MLSFNQFCEGIFTNKLKSEIKKLGHKIISSDSDFGHKVYYIKVKGKDLKIVEELNGEFSILIYRNNRYFFVNTDYKKIEDLGNAIESIR